jgi:hypothetical protein
LFADFVEIQVNLSCNHEGEEEPVFCEHPSGDIAINVEGYVVEYVFDTQGLDAGFLGLG